MSKLNRRDYFVKVCILSTIILGVILFPYLRARMARKTPSQTPPADAQSQVKKRVVNKADSFRLVKVSRKGDDCTFSFRNDYNRSIDGYSYFVGSERSVEDVDLTIGDRSIAPGAVQDITVRMSKMESAGGNQPSLGILAVMLEDGTGDGEAETVKKNHDRREGLTSQLKRVRPLIKQALRADEAGLPAAVQRLKDAISSLEERADSGSAAFNFGLHGAKQQLVTEIESAETDNSTLRTRLQETQNRMEKKIARMTGKGKS